MRKQVTFVEEGNKREHLTQYSGRRISATRSAGYCYPRRNILTGFGSPYADQDVSTETQKARTNSGQHVSAQQMKTVHIPKSMMSAPFLQHPDLTTGQKKYLCSIANIYSTDHMRKLMRRQYQNTLHQCMRTGYNASRENQNPGVKLQHQQTRMTAAGSKTVPVCHHKCKPTSDRNTATAHSERLVLPRIAGHHRAVCSTSAPNENQPRKSRKESCAPQNTSVRDADTKKELGKKRRQTGEDTLSENISSLSLEEEEQNPSAN
uniref:Family with sequence similarity 216 member A n=1 Tax=Lepisosteus oculatus TaxID=7918 RepID=W5MK77_LEPOC|nr:PREDICTED: protein FAM216A [Lepisosteus oculatus]XP_015221862.1 PREDICTED: protein FAM216A [Lepisosteus oculatus]